MDINPADIVVDTFNTGSSWIPKFNGVIVTHKPTGISVRCSTERGQHANKFKAFEELCNKLGVETDFTKQMELF